MMRETLKNKSKKRKSKVPVFLSIVIIFMTINILVLSILEFRSLQSEQSETGEQDANSIVIEYMNKGV